jgi:hypothetical protein
MIEGYAQVLMNPDLFVDEGFKGLLQNRMLSENA